MGSNINKPVILTGVRANNDLHIGNYFGAMLPIVDMAKKRADEYQINMFLPDLHSFTTPVDHSKLYQSVINTARTYIAAGLPIDKDNVYLYRQSAVPSHSELTWILSCFTSMGQMERMIQYKDKSKKLSDDQINVGLFSYPILMACDMLLYDAKYVPVGDDQTQHIEFTRDIAERLNNKFGNIFKLPESVEVQHEFFGKDQGLRIKDLQDPSKKMSKSDDTGAGVIFLSDSPEEGAKKIMRATTDSLASVNYDKDNQPGITNLIDILALLRDTTPAAVEAEFKGMKSYGDFKKVVADEVAEFLRVFQENLANVDDAAVAQKLESSEAAINIQANETLLRVQKAVGLRS